MENTDIKARKEFIIAMCEAKKVIKQPLHDCKVKFNQINYSYSSLGEIIKCLNPLLDHGIYYQQGERCIDETWVMWTEIFHIGGHSRSHRTFIKAPLNIREQIEVHQLQNPDTNKYKKALILNSEKDFASSITYARRYALCSIFGLYGQEDIDALPEIVFEQESMKKAVVHSPKYISNSLKEGLKKRCQENKEFKERLNKSLENLKIPSIDSIVIEREGFYRESLEHSKAGTLPPPIDEDEGTLEGVYN